MAEPLKFLKMKPGHSYNVRFLPPYTPTKFYTPNSTIAAFTKSKAAPVSVTPVAWDAEFQCKPRVGVTIPKPTLTKISLGKTLMGYVDRLAAKGLKMSPEGIWLCGGAIRRAVCGTAIEEGDFDIYVRAAQWLKMQDAKTSDWTLKDKNDKKPGMTTFDYDIDKLNVQIHVMQISQTLQEVIGAFDFTCCQFGYDGVQAWEVPGAVADARGMKLEYTGSTGLYTTARAFRFIEMGFKPTKSFLKRMQELAARPIHEELGIPKKADGRS
jgi:hypothetical protein